MGQKVTPEEITKSILKMLTGWSHYDATAILESATRMLSNNSQVVGAVAECDQKADHKQAL
jgi:hypothetical protein